MRSPCRRLDGVSRVRLKRNTFGQVQLGGQRRVYHHLLSVCWLLYRVNPGGRRRIDWADAYTEDAANRARIPVMEADVILESPDRRIILDTKFYSDALARGRGSGTGKLHSPNLYQLLAYLRNRQATRPAGARHDGILLYPQVGEEPLRAEVWPEGFRIQARTVDFSEDWRGVHEEMLETVGIGGSNSA